MKCTVIGGSGFMGSHLVRVLLASGADVTVLDKAETLRFDRKAGSAPRLIVGDFDNPEDVRRALSDCEILYHLAWTTVPQTSNESPTADLERNVLASIRLIEGAHNAQVRKIIFASSGGTVYGMAHELPIKESHPTEPISSYGIGKLTVEKYLHLYWTLHHQDYCVLRTSNAYGEGEPTSGVQGVIGASLERAMRGEEIVIWGDGSIVRDYVYVGDVVDAFVKAASQRGEPRVFNVGSGRGHSLNEVIDLVEGVIGRRVSRKYLPGRIFDVPSNVLDVSRAQEHLNWQPTIGLAEGISRTHEWMLSARPQGQPGESSHPEPGTGLA